MKEAIYYNPETNIIATIKYDRGIKLSTSKSNRMDYLVKPKEYKAVLVKITKEYIFIGYV